MDNHLLLNQIIEILHAYHDQHYDDFDPREGLAWRVEDPSGYLASLYGIDYEWPYLQGWWVISPDLGWDWWLGVYTRDPAGQDLETFPFCNLDAPLPNADLSRLGVLT